MLEECGLIVREFDACGQRTIRPLATAVELIEAGWASLASAIQPMRSWPAAIRAVCRCLLQCLGSWRREPDLARLGLSSRGVSSAVASNCAASARPFPVKASEALKTTTLCSAVSESKPSPVVVLPAEKSLDREPEPAAVAIAVEAGLDREVARKAVREKPIGAVRTAIQAAKAYAASHEVRSLPALLFTAIRNGWLPPAPPATSAADRGERPVRYVTAPPEVLAAERRRREEREAPQAQHAGLSPKKRLAQIRAQSKEVPVPERSAAPSGRSVEVETGLVRIRTQLAALQATASDAGERS